VCGEHGCRDEARSLRRGQAAPVSLDTVAGFVVEILEAGAGALDRAGEAQQAVVGVGDRAGAGRRRVRAEPGEEDHRDQVAHAADRVAVAEREVRRGGAAHNHGVVAAVNGDAGGFIIIRAAQDGAVGIAELRGAGVPVQRSDKGVGQTGAALQLRQRDGEVARGGLAG
jgi:hypothetical protein